MEKSLIEEMLEKARKAELKMQENAIDAMGEAVEDTVTPDDNIDKPTVTRKKDEESEP